MGAGIGDFPTGRGMDDAFQVVISTTRKDIIGVAYKLKFVGITDFEIEEVEQ